ncbi:hypothetical protein ASF10_20140 [Flavobacterium sp. Leaf82]|jgi:hypothetical protein|uniref:hypothetical protein n=1 Tax=unclassified Flavobacterium TaxID=196869 RepID=UPI0006FE5507|nr:hypothetical protein [Flavobacterium sp. Leaf82]KQO32768.1 hypothetical protein ASF10_20140 [Flavobacterium sp. Leaf82]
MKNILILIILLIFQKSISQNKIVAKAKFLNVFDLTNAYDYTQEDNDTLINSKVISKLPESILESGKGISIKLLTKIKIIYNNEEHIYIKYSEKRDNISTLKIIDILSLNGAFMKNESVNILFDPVKKIMNSVNANLMFEFYNKEDDVSYPEVNKLKPLVKSSNGILDINKLADVIEKNKIVLSKYLSK